MATEGVRLSSSMETILIDLFDEPSPIHAYNPNVGVSDWTPPFDTEAVNWRNDAEVLLFETPIIPNDADTAWMTPFVSKGGFSPLSGAGDDDDATDLEDVVVVGDWEFPPLIPYSPGGGSPPDGSGDPTGGGGGGGGSSGPDVRGLEGHEGVACATNDIRDDINSQSTNDSSEHVGIVFQGSDGRYYSSPGFTGASGEVDYVQLGQWMAGRNISLSDIVVIYHNHDATSSTNPDPDLHRYPSNQNTVAPGANHDWMAYDAFVAGGVNAGTLLIAIEDQNGVVRFFDYDDRDAYANMTREEMERRENLPSEAGGCGG